MEKYLNYATDLLVKYGPKVIMALLLLIIGLYVIKFIVRTFKKVMSARNLEVTLQKFLGNLLGWTLKVLLFVTAAATLGVQTTSFAAILASAGLAVGLALQGSLANFAGGVLIMIFKPFKVGDLIEAQGEMEV